MIVSTCLFSKCFLLWRILSRLRLGEGNRLIIFSQITIERLIIRSASEWIEKMFEFFYGISKTKMLKKGIERKRIGKERGNVVFIND